MSDPGTGTPGGPVALPFGPEATEPLPGAAPPPHTRTAPLPVVGASLGAEPPDPPADAAPGHRGWLVPVLAAAAALLLVATVVLAALLVTAKGGLDRARADAVASRQAADTRAREATAARDEAAALESDLARARADLAATRAQLTGAQSRLGSTEADKQVISNCLGLILDFFDAAGAGDGEKARGSLAEADKPCEDANALTNP
jgi:hypothetical protein